MKTAAPAAAPPRIRRRWAWLVVALAASGCSEEEKVAPSVLEPPTLRVIRPTLRTIRRTVGQPSFVQAYERSSIYPKLSAYIEKWNVDIGDRVRKGDVLADLFVPELQEYYGTKKATVVYDAERVRLAEKDVEVAAAKVEAAKARLKEAQEILAKYTAEVERWEVQVARLATEVERRVVAPQILLESKNELKADIAARDAALATIKKASAELQAEEAALARAEVNVGVAKADLSVAESEKKRYEALVGYLKLFAPFDGIVVARNANTWDFVLPRTGDPTAEMRSPDLSPGDKAAPIYVVDRTDIIRVYVDIPERDADYIHVGSAARVKIWAHRDAWIPATVTRLAWALNNQSRTMRAEIDLPNTESRILPGMYAYGKVEVERPGIRAVPETVLSHAGGKTFFWRYEEGRARRTEVETGARDGDWIELTHLRTASGPSEGFPDDVHDEDGWAAADGTELVLTGSKLSTLTDGAPVRLSEAPPEAPDGDRPRPNAIRSSGAG